MPLLKAHPKPETLVKRWDKAAERSGVRSTVFWVSGEEYRGEWLNNKKHGSGTQVWRKAGVLYDGEWRCGKREGFGTLSKLHPLSDEYVKVYSGEWKNDKKEGFGTQFYGPNSWYEGQWAGHQRSGWGRMFFPNGDVYEGEWMKNKPHGHGVLKLVNENRYEGGWKDGQKHGPGQFWFRDQGQLYEGFWVDGVAKCGTVCDFGREQAATPTSLLLPQVQLKDPECVLREGLESCSQIRDD